MRYGIHQTVNGRFIFMPLSISFSMTSHRLQDDEKTLRLRQGYAATSRRFWGDGNSVTSKDVSN